MKIAICWGLQHPLKDITVRLELYRDGFLELGHEAVIVSSRAAAEGFPYSVTTVDDLEILRQPGFWKELGASMVVIVTWLLMEKELWAIRQAGATAVAITDSDGIINLRQYPIQTLGRALEYQPSVSSKLRATKFWLQRLLYDKGEGERKMIQSAKQSDVMLFCSDEARRDSIRYFTSRGVADMQAKARAVPYPVREIFYKSKVADQRKKQVVAIGRWSAWQKNTPLLARTLKQLIKRDPSVKFIIAGLGGEEFFRDLPGDSVRCVGSQPPDRIAEILGESMTLLITSRYESGPVAAYEALCMGCSVVCTPIPNASSFCTGEGAGKVARRASPTEMANAVIHDLRDWENGLRQPQVTSATWRAKVNPTGVCQQIVDAIAAGRIGD